MTGTDTAARTVLGPTEIPVGVVTALCGAPVFAASNRVIARLRGKLAKEPGASLFLQPVQDIRIGGRQSNAQYQFTLQADDLSDLRAWEQKIRVALSQRWSRASIEASAARSSGAASAATSGAMAERMAMMLRTTLVSTWPRLLIKRLGNSSRPASCR